SATLKVLAKEFMRKTGFKLNGKRINVTAGHFARIKKEPCKDELLGMTSKCKVSKIVWNNSYIKKGVTVDTRRVTVTY
ncbi:MAG: hypothetical protein GXP03_11275, partial [Alphaproteobacteria bacterium]|nr:hypothetical protein [Alphaproteobacteria bacterium]